jgi:hypothetical protein
MSRTIRKGHRSCICSRCQAGRQFNGTKRAAVAATQVAELDLPGFDPEVSFPHVGSDVTCRCVLCNDVWSDILWLGDEPECDRCKGPCLL